MNKRFFTLMAAVMLTGGVVPYVAYAQEESPTTEETTEVADDNFVSYSASKLKLANGVKFIVKAGDSYVAVKKGEKVKNGTFLVIDEEAEDVTPETAAVFEVRNYTKNGLGVTFSLYVNGQQFAVGGDEETDAALVFTANKEKLGEITSVTVAKLTADGDDAFGDETVSLGSYKVNYSASLLNDNNRNGISLSFDADNLEGNVFDGVKAITIPVPEARAAAGPNFQGDYIYLVKGTDTNIDKFLAAQNKTTASKLTFVYVKNEQYDINALVDGEGYKLVTINGAAFYDEADKAALVENAAFTSIEEGDALNAEGLLRMVISPKVGTPAMVVGELVVAAIKPSATDTKTYVTLVNEGEAAGSTFSAIYPSLSGNTFFAASEFLAKNAISAYNIYFTSNNDNKSTEETSTEYHKYLAVAGASETDGDLDLIALAKSDLDLDTPYAQWIATGFDNRYTLTLTNRATGESLSIKLAATDKANEYDIVGNTEETIGNTDDEIALTSTTIKLIPTTVGKYDGFMNLSKAEIEAGLKLSFSGADATVGEKTYYAGMGETSAETPVLVPVADAKKAHSLKVAAVEYEEGDGVIKTAYAYIDANGKVATATEHPDSLMIPAYTFSYKYTPADSEEAVTKYAAVGNNNAIAFNKDEAADASRYVIVKALDGQYVLAAEKDDAVKAINVATVTGANTNGKMAITWSADVLAPAKSDFAYVAVNVNDNSDKTSLAAVSRHAAFESEDGAIAFRENKNGILEGILSAEPMTFWLDTADSEMNTPSFYISKGIAAVEETKAYDGGVRNFLYTPVDSALIFDEETAIESVNGKYILEGTEANLKAIFRPANLIAEDTLATVADGEEIEVTGDAIKAFKYGICLLSEDAEDEYVVYSKLTNEYLYSLNGKLGFTPNVAEALVVTLGEGDATANEAIAAEAGVQVIGGQGVVTVQGAAGKVVTVANILGQTIANQVAASDNVTIAVPAGIVVVAVDGEATKVVVK